MSDKHATLLALREAATAGEWKADCDFIFTWDDADEVDPVGTALLIQDAAYIVAACNAYPGLIAERDRLRAALEECITDDGAVCFEHREYLARRVGVVSDIARAALNQDKE